MAAKKTTAKQQATASQASTTTKGTTTKKKTTSDTTNEAETKQDVKKIPGVRPVKGRPYCAGAVLKKYGLEVGITDEIVQEIDTMTGNSNMKESAAWAKIAWQIINGYEQAVPI